MSRWHTPVLSAATRADADKVCNVLLKAGLRCEVLSFQESPAEWGGVSGLRQFVVWVHDLERKDARQVFHKVMLEEFGGPPCDKCGARPAMHHIMSGVEPKWERHYCRECFDAAAEFGVGAEQGGST